MRLLLIEDDVQFAEALAFGLKQRGISADLCSDGADAPGYLEEHSYDLILLDRMLPHIDGISLLKRLRKANDPTPVIILTALGDVNDRITGLDSGADDYLVKPFEFEELIARIRSIQRRPRSYVNTQRLLFADLTYFPETHLLQGSRASCTLSRTEGELFELLIRNPEQTLPRDTILSRIWGPYGSVEEGNLDNYIYFVRRRLKLVSASTQIRTIRGIGYRLEHDTAPADDRREPK